MSSSITPTLGNHHRYIHTKSRNQRHRLSKSSHHRFNISSVSRLGLLHSNAFGDIHDFRFQVGELEALFIATRWWRSLLLTLLVPRHSHDRPCIIELLRIPIMGFHHLESSSVELHCEYPFTRLSFHHLESFSSNHIHACPCFIKMRKRKQSQKNGGNKHGELGFLSHCRRVSPLWWDRHFETVTHGRASWRLIQLSSFIAWFSCGERIEGA